MSLLASSQISDWVLIKFPANFVTFPKEMFNGKLHFLCSVWTVQYASFYYKQLISNVKMRMAKNQENTNHHPEAELLLFENYSHSSSTLSSKNNGTYSKK